MHSDFAILFIIYFQKISRTCHMCKICYCKINKTLNEWEQLVWNIWLYLLIRNSFFLQKRGVHLYSLVAKYIGTCLKIRLFYELNVKKKAKFINASQNEGLFPSCLVQSFVGFGWISWHHIFGCFFFLFLLQF
jgi:hypothetical protein